MNLPDRISTLQSSAKRQLHALGGKKKTENALVLPFFEALGYNPFDMRQVEPRPEITPGGSNAEAVSCAPKVDYALKKEGSPTMLVRCREAKADIGAFEKQVREGGSVLERLGDLEAEVAVLTNGLTYQFYTGLGGSDRAVGHPSDGHAGGRRAGEKRGAGERPFLKFNLLGHEAEELQMLRRLSRPAFDREEIRQIVFDRQARRRLRSYLAGQRESPSDLLVRFLAAQIYDGEVPSGQIDRFRPIVQEVVGELVEEGGIEERDAEEGKESRMEGLEESRMREDEERRPGGEQNSQEHRSPSGQSEADQEVDQPETDQPEKPAAVELEVSSKVGSQVGPDTSSETNSPETHSEVGSSGANPRDVTVGDGAAGDGDPADWQKDAASQEEDGKGPFDKNLAKRVIEEV